MQAFFALNLGDFDCAFFRQWHANGNVITDAVNNFTYDSKKRLVNVVTDSGETVDYVHNSVGQRVIKANQTTAQTSMFTFDQVGQLIGEYNTDGTLISETIYMQGMPVGVWRDNTLYRVYSDHLNTPRVITTEDGLQNVWQWSSDAFGSAPANEDPSNSGALFVFNQRFPRQYLDSETGIHYNYFRDYDPSTGRYLQSDPIGLGGGMNTFGYALANPIVFYDENGNTPAHVTGGVVGGISGGIGSFTVGYASGQRGWKLFRSTVTGVGVGAAVGAATLNPAAASTAATSLIPGTVGGAIVRTSVTGALSNTAGQLSTIAFDQCAEFSTLQVGLSAIPGPFGVMNPLAIASRYRTGGIIYSIPGSNIAAGVQLGTFGTLRGLNQTMIDMLANPDHYVGCTCTEN